MSRTAAGKAGTVFGSLALMGCMGYLPLYFRQTKDNLYMREGGLGNQILASPGNLSPTRDVGPDPDYDNTTGAYRGIGYRGKGIAKDGKALSEARSDVDGTAA